MVIQKPTYVSISNNLECTITTRIYITILALQLILEIENVLRLELLFYGDSN